MSLAEPTNQCGLDVGHGHGVHFYPGLLLLKMSHDGAFKFSIGDRWRESKSDGHADGVVGGQIVEVALGFVNGPIREQGVLQKDDIAEAGFDRHIFVGVLLGVGEKLGQFANDGVLDGDGVVGYLSNNIRAPDGGIGMNSFFISESNRSEVVGGTGPLERGLSFSNHFVNGAVTGVAIIGNWWGR